MAEPPHPRPPTPPRARQPTSPTHPAANHRSTAPSGFCKPRPCAAQHVTGLGAPPAPAFPPAFFNHDPASPFGAPLDPALFGNIPTAVVPPRPAGVAGAAAIPGRHAVVARRVRSCRDLLEAISAAYACGGCDVCFGAPSSLIVDRVVFTCGVMWARVYEDRCVHTPHACSFGPTRLPFLHVSLPLLQTHQSYPLQHAVDRRPQGRQRRRLGDGPSTVAPSSLPSPSRLQRRLRCFVFSCSIRVKEKLATFGHKPASFLYAFFVNPPLSSQPPWVVAPTDTGPCGRSEREPLPPPCAPQGCIAMVLPDNRAFTPPISPLLCLDDHLHSPTSPCPPLFRPINNMTGPHLTPRRHARRAHRSWLHITPFTCHLLPPFFTLTWIPPSQQWIHDIPSPQTPVTVITDLSPRPPTPPSDFQQWPSPAAFTIVPDTDSESDEGWNDLAEFQTLPLPYSRERYYSDLAHHLPPRQTRIADRLWFIPPWPEHRAYIRQSALSALPALEQAHAAARLALRRAYLSSDSVPSAVWDTYLDAHHAAETAFLNASDFRSMHWPLHTYVTEPQPPFAPESLTHRNARLAWRRLSVADQTWLISNLPTLAMIIAEAQQCPINIDSYRTMAPHPTSLPR